MPINALPHKIQNDFEIHEWRHATAILERDFPNEWGDVCDVLSRFKLCKSYLLHLEEESLKYLNGLTASCTKKAGLKRSSILQS